MTVIAEYTMTARALALGRAALEGMHVELVQVIEDDSPVAYFWMWDGSTEAFEQAVAEQGAIDDLQVIDDTATRRLYRGEYDVDEDTLLEGMVESDSVVLEALGDHEEWDLLLRFPDADAFQVFQREYVDDRAVSVDGVYGAADPARSSETDLTRRQRETLLTAYREGYFDIPRKITLVDLAGELGVSDQAVSERLRRGEAKLVRSHLFED